MEPCSYNSPKKKRDVCLASSQSRTRWKGPQALGRSGSLSLGKQAGSIVQMLKALPAFGLCYGKCSHNPPGRVGMTPFTDQHCVTATCQPTEARSPSRCEAPGNTGQNAVWYPNSSQCTTVTAFFRATHPSPCVSPQLLEVSLATSICICGAWARRGQVTYPRTRSY